MKKWIISILAIIVAVGAGSAYYLWNKGEVNIEKASAIPVSATDLYTAYSKDTISAKTKFTGKIVAVSGIANAVSANQQNLIVVQISTGIEGAYINCTAEAANTIPGVSSGDKVTIKGICKGIGEGDKDLGILGDVYLTRCHLVK